MERKSQKVMALLASTLIIMSIFAVLPIGPAASTETLPDYEAVDWQTGLAGPVEMPTIEETSAETTTVESFASTPPVGTVVWDWYLWAISRNDYGGAGQKAWMTLRAQVGNVEVWVQNDLRFYFNATYNDPRNAFPQNYTISDAQAQYVAEVFNSVIYPTDTTFFGMPYDRDGSGNIFIGSSYPTAPPNWWYWIEAPDNPQRVILKVLNARDTNYYDPTYPTYTAGFYTPTYTRTYYKRNMIHIDCWQWWRRLGPVGYHWYPDTTVPPDRANLYESVVAHEFQHNIHRDWNPNDETFMNEGCSEYSQILCGWPHTLWSHINNYLYTPDNSLTVWGDQGDINILADYGAAALWTMYLSDRYGGSDTIRYFVQAGIPGIAGVNNALAYYGYTATFDTVFHDWRIANLIHSNLVADSRYYYDTLDLGSPSGIPIFKHPVSGLPVPPTKGTDFGPTWTYLGYNTGVSKLGTYGTDYIVLKDWPYGGKIFFDGDDTSVYGWTYSGGVWYSGAANMLNTLIYADAYVDPTNPTLELVTRYDTESLYDYAFVQVSTDGGNTWVSLSNAYTTSNHASDLIAPILANLPGLNGRSPGWPNVLTMTFDLTAYSGQTVRIGFRYMTDPGTLGNGWYINSAKVCGVAITPNAVYPPAYFQVTAIRVYLDRKGKIIDYIVNDIDLLTGNTGIKGANIKKPNYIILAVSVINTMGAVDYTFWADMLNVRDCGRIVL
jgi:hypothetical protein